MEFRTNRKALLNTVRALAGVVPPNPGNPVLSHFRVTLGAKRLTLEATDLDLAASASLAVEARTEQAGAILVPAGELSAILRRDKSEKLTIASDDKGAVTVSGDGTSYRLTASDPLADFPEFPAIPEGAPNAVIAANPFARLVNLTAFAAAKERTRYALNGVLVERQDGTVRFTATDGRRLATATIPGDSRGPRGKKASAIVPVKALALAEKLGGDMTAHLGKDATGFAGATWTLIARNVDGHFPPYEDVIPKGDMPHVFTADRKAFLAAVESAATAIGPDYGNDNAVRITFDGSGGATVTDLRGRTKASFPADYSGERFVIGFDPDYLAEALKAVDTDRVTVGLKDRVSAAKITADGVDWTYVLMPVAIEVSEVAEAIAGVEPAIATA